VLFEERQTRLRIMAFEWQLNHVVGLKLKCGFRGFEPPQQHHGVNRGLGMKGEERGTLSRLDAFQRQLTGQDF
jgi:hypothetical protein